jgi:hypothetical protein
VQRESWPPWPPLGSAACTRQRGQNSHPWTQEADKRGRSPAGAGASGQCDSETNGGLTIDASVFLMHCFWWMGSECLLNFPPQTSHITNEGGGILPEDPEGRNVNQRRRRPQPSRSLGASRGVTPVSWPQPTKGLTKGHKHSLVERLAPADVQDRVKTDRAEWLSIPPTVDTNHQLKPHWGARLGQFGLFFGATE